MKLRNKIRTFPPGNIKGKLFFIAIFILLFVLLATISEASPKNVKIAVLFPQTHGAYEKVFENIITGIKSRNSVSIRTYSVKKDTTPQEVNAWLASLNVQAVIALGQRSHRIVKKLRTSLPVVIGALVVPSNAYSTLSLAADPDAMFSSLKKLMPSTKRVFIVYSEKDSGWLIKLANISAKKHDIQLKLYPSQNIREAVANYRTVLDTARSNADAIWLPMDRIAPDKTILPLALEVAWKRGLVLFCSNPVYVKRGALFGLYPDHEKMGAELVELLKKQLGNREPHLIIPTRKLKFAFNQRTASHLGLHYSKNQLREFDLVYPSPR